jgi:7-cyano-7-deazaguanine synthase in queuosine biosynthesis
VENIVLLNSGGFDSVVLANYTRGEFPDSEITSLFFDYGQKIVNYERACAQKVCEKINSEFIEIKLPKFSWSKGTFYDETEVTLEGEYIELRNLIFMSYALSLAESRKATLLGIAVLTYNIFYDSSTHFLEHFGAIAEGIGVKLYLPFMFLDKVQLNEWVEKFNVLKEDFFSCDNPVNNLPCGFCNKCVEINQIFELVEFSKVTNPPILPSRKLRKITHL